MFRHLLALAGMDDKNFGKVLVSLRDSPRFSADLWHEFRETARANNESWVDALRRMVERYIAEHRSSDQGPSSS